MANSSANSAQKQSTRQSRTDLPQETTLPVDICRNHRSDLPKVPFRFVFIN